MLSNEAKIAILRQLLADHGKLTAELVVSIAAEAKDDPDHYAYDLARCFNWDDASAAHSYRVEQARAICRLVRIEVREDNRAPFLVPVFVHTPKDVNGGYTELQTAFAPDQREILNEELNQILYRVNRAKGIAISIREGRPRFPTLTLDFDALTVSVEKIREKVKHSSKFYSRSKVEA